MADMEITRELLSDKVYDVIRVAILDGSRAPGSRIVESEIARKLSVSQAPVREAVKRLVHEGLVTSEPRRGSYVTEVSPAEFEIAREARAALEGIGARSAVVSVESSDLDRLRAIVERMAVAVKTGDWATFRTLDMEFHGFVMSIGGHALLVRLWATLEPILVTQRAIGDPAFPGNRNRVVGWHEDLIRVLEERDPDRAADAFFAHAAGALTPTD